MPTTTINRNRVLARTVSSSGSTTYRLAAGGARTETRPTLARRPRPSNLALQSSQTNWSFTMSDCVGDVCQVPIRVWTSFNPPAYVDHYYAMSEVTAIDYHKSNPDYSQARMAAILQNKALRVAKEGSVNLANLLGEYRQTASLFGDLSKGLVDVSRAVLKRDPTAFRQMFFGKAGTRLDRRASSLLLKWRYGVEPLVADLDGVRVALYERVEKDIVFPFNVSHREQYSDVTKSSLRVDSPEMITVHHKGTHHARFKGFHKLKNTFMLDSLGQFGMTNPVSLLYELTPHSFVLDWWCNLGEVLASLDNQLYIDTGGMGNIIYRYNGVSHGQVLGGSYWSLRQSYSRVPTVPSTTVKFLYKPSVSRRHIENGIALINLFLTSKR